MAVRALAQASLSGPSTVTTADEAPSSDWPGSWMRHPVAASIFFSIEPWGPISVPIRAGFTLTLTVGSLGLFASAATAAAAAASAAAMAAAASSMGAA